MPVIPASSSKNRTEAEAYSRLLICMEMILAQELPGRLTCSRMLKTSACAFSTSSKRTTAYGRRLHQAVPGQASITYSHQCRIRCTHSCAARQCLLPKLREPERVTCADKLHSDFGQLCSPRASAL